MQKATRQDHGTAMMERLAGQLIGRRIVAIVTVEGAAMGWDGHCVPAFALVFDDGSSASVLSDPEGNGPGYLDVHGGPGKAANS